MVRCENEGCQNDSSIISRLSTRGLLIRNSNDTNSFIDAYQKYNYCKNCHDNLLERIWENMNIDN